MISTRPVADGGHFFTTQDTTTLYPWHFTSGSALSYSQTPFRAILGNAAVNVVGTSFYQHFYGSIGLPCHMSVSLDLPVFWYHDFTNPDTRPPASNEFGLGDLQITTKWRLLNHLKYGVGLSFAPFLTIPTGDTSTFMGDDGVTGGGLFIFDAPIGNRIFWAVNMGGLIRKEFNAYGLTFDEQFLFSTAFNFRILKYLSLITEISTKTPFTDFFQSKDTTPTEWRNGIQMILGRNKNIIINTAGLFGIAYGTGSPHYGAMLGLTYKSPLSLKYKEHIISKVEKTVFFDSGKADINRKISLELGKIGLVLYDNFWIDDLLIEGHTDDIGTKAYNQKLSDKRAQTVEIQLKQKSPKHVKIQTQGLGETKPVLSNKTNDDRQKNRRATITVR